MVGEFLKFLVDVGVSIKVESWLIEQGYKKNIYGKFCVYKDNTLRIRR